jgi:hypothetical protein
MDNVQNCDSYINIPSSDTHKSGVVPRLRHYRIILNFSFINHPMIKRYAQSRMLLREPNDNINMQSLNNKVSVKFCITFQENLLQFRWTFQALNSSLNVLFNSVVIKAFEILQNCGSRIIRTEIIILIFRWACSIVPVSNNMLWKEYKMFSLGFYVFCSVTRIGSSLFM